jgi:4-hydroxyphenylpyruvate dioxygenase
MTSMPVAEASQTQNLVEITGTDHVEFYVGNAKQAAYYYQRAFGFSLVAYAGPETGRRDAASYVLQQGKIRFVLTTPLAAEGFMPDHIRRHGDGVRDVAFTVVDVAQAYAAAIANGGTAITPPHEASDEFGTVQLATIGTYGDTVHTFVQRDGYKGAFLPGYAAKGKTLPDAGLLRIDHIVGNVEWDKMNHWADYYTKTLGFHRFVSFDDKDISTEFTALRSVVVTNPNELIKMPINEPAEGKKKSQIEEYIDFYGGAGVQHIAIETGDILASVRQLRANGVEFLDTPATYYENLLDRVGPIKEDIAALQAESILVDRDDSGYMLQIFTKPLEDRPTLFIEIIQRRGGRSFGKGNFKALFESIEREQEARGNL